MARNPADISNAALRIFLQEMGKAYDRDRALQPFRAPDFTVVKDFFGGMCCYCGVAFGNDAKAVQDHLIPNNVTDMGLHAWGNVVSACHDCNAVRQRQDWRRFIIRRAGPHAAERHDRVETFVAAYRYDSSITAELRARAKDLYREVQVMSMALVDLAVSRSLSA